MRPIRKILAANLPRIRRERSVTQSDLALRAEVNRGYISDLESAKYSATVEMLGKLARALSVAPGDLLKGAQEGQAHPISQPDRPSAFRQAPIPSLLTRRTGLMHDGPGRR